MPQHDLEKPVFLSASVPVDEQRDDKDPIYFENQKKSNFFEAVRQLAERVLRRGRLVFGGHLLVTPKILEIADGLDKHPLYNGTLEGKPNGDPSFYKKRVILYQSCFFRKRFSSEVNSFPSAVCTPAVDANKCILPADKEEDGDREMSLLYMRYRMVGVGDGNQDFPGSGDLAKERKKYCSTEKFHAAFFMGGMDGVEQEYKIFRKFHPKTKVFILPTTGSAASILFRTEKDHMPPRDAKILEKTTPDLYGPLFGGLLNDVQ